MSSSVLVLGDAFFPIQGARTMLTMLGCGMVGPARSLDHAMQLMTESLPHAAILDIELGQSFVFSVADMLAGLDIPFGFAGGGSLLSTIPERHLRRPTVHKPYGINHLEQLLRGLGCVRRLRTPA